MSQDKSSMKTIAVVGLGYVGLPLAVAFGRHIDTIGFDTNTSKLASYLKGVDPGGDLSSEDIAAAKFLQFTSDAKSLERADAIIMVVPTPINHARTPDLKPLKDACRTIAQYMQAGVTIIFESTVYPGCTEEECVPILERHSNLKWLGSAGKIVDPYEQGFYVGYSPERINPGDKHHRLENTIKVIAGDTPETLERIERLYQLVVDAGLHRAASIKVAEAAKVIENTQRDLNIALMNELSLIFDRLGIDTLDVLEAAGTKWNFLPFRPGLVGGHCIGVDPYYLTYKAESIGYHPQVILAGRRINDNMGRFVAEKTVKALAKKERSTVRAKVIVLGLTFKEDCPDLRNSRVIDIVDELREYSCEVYVHDPVADPEAALEEYSIELVVWSDLPKADAVIVAVPHKRFKVMKSSDFSAILIDDGILMDVKSCLDRVEIEAGNFELWRL